MTTIPDSLLPRLSDHRDDSAWQHFFDHYAPRIFHIARSRGLRHSDAEDARDQCLAILTDRLQSGAHEDRGSSLCSWINTIAHRCAIDVLRRRYRCPAVTSPDLTHYPNPRERTENQCMEDQLQHLESVLERVRWRVSARSYRVFEALVLKDRSVTDVCAELNMNPNQVYKAKQRVLSIARTIADRMRDA